MYERMLLLLRDEAIVRNAFTVVSPFHFSLVPILFIPILSGRSRKCPFFVQNPRPRRRVGGGLPDRSLGERGCVSAGCVTQAAKRSSCFPGGNT